MSDSLRDAKALLDRCFGKPQSESSQFLLSYIRDLVAEVERLQAEQSPPVMFAALMTKLKEECEAQHARAEQAEAERDRWQQVAEDTELERMTTRAERDRLRAALNRTNRYDCPECGLAVAVDEDGCCRSCGADTTLVLGRRPEGA